MNISYNWLNDLIDIEMPPEELAHRLTFVGLTVEGVHSVSDDFILDIDLTSNRPDCLSHLGVAREIGVMTGSTLKLPDEVRTDDIPMPVVLAHDIVQVEAADLCHRFTARVVRNVKIGPSPDWLAKRLEYVGERAINNIADITNYVMLELGQPMHAFDLDKLKENRIVVRRSRPRESITTLDETERQLEPSMLAICDAEKPVAVAGVMGGLDSGISDETSNVLLEVAYFDPHSIRQTSRKLKLTTEASHRFERGADIENLIRASNRASELICELAGGTLGELIDVYPTRFEPREVESVDLARAVERLTSLKVDQAECDRILAALGIEKKQETFYVSPTWRHDIGIEEDLVEEVVRHVGYDKIGDELPPAYSAGEYQVSEWPKRSVRQRLVDAGFDETISYSFIDTRFDGSFESVPGLTDPRTGERFVELRDPVIEGAVRMRPSNLPGMLDAIRRNFNFQRRDLKLFEIGKAFAARSGEDGLPEELELLTLAVTGGEVLGRRMLTVRELDFYDVKGAVELALEAVGVGQADFSAVDVTHLQRGQSASISVAGTVVGSVGRLGQTVASLFKFKQPVYVAEVDLGSLLRSPVVPVTYQPLSRYPAVIRDVTFKVGRNITFYEIERVIHSENMELCRSIRFVDVFEGKASGDGQRSITVRLEYRSDERTLVENEADEAHRRIVESVISRLGVSV